MSGIKMLKQEIKIGKEGVQNFKTGEFFGFINPEEIEFKEQIGYGAGGSVHLAAHIPSGTPVAIKVRYLCLTLRVSTFTNSPNDMS
jgi:hypothetical protein